MNRTIIIKRAFQKVLIHSLNTRQINYLGGLLDGMFNVFKESGFGERMPLPQQTAADTLLRYFKKEEDIVKLFTYLLHSNGKHFYNADLQLRGKEEFIILLEKYKWVLDRELVLFFLDPFFENEINFLDSVRFIDLRGDIPLDKIVKGISKISEKLKGNDLEWQITLRLYDLDGEKASLVREIINLLLVTQNLESYAFEMFTCFKELAINASKANYKKLFEKYVTAKESITSDNNYSYFLRLFKTEIEENGNSNLLELAKKDDSFINLTFQSTKESFDIWVTNSSNITVIEKNGLMNRLKVDLFQKEIEEDQFGSNDDVTDDEFQEGAGMGINLVLSILKQYIQDKAPLKVIYYPDFFKIGFTLDRQVLVDNLANK